MRIRDRLFVLDPERRRATVHQPDADTTTLSMEGTLDLCPTVPDFSLQLRELFSRPPRA